MVRAKFFMIAQDAYVLNLLPREKSNFSTARISDMLPSETSSKKLLEGPTCRLAIETTSRRFARIIWFLTARASSCSRSIWSRSGGFGRAGIELRADQLALIFQIIHLAEQVHLLFAVQQEEPRTGWPGKEANPWAPWAVVAPCRRPARALVRGSAAASSGIGEAGVVDEFELGLEKPPGPHLIDDTVDARARSAVLSGQDLGRNAHAKAPVDLCLGFVVERGQRVRKDGPIGVIAVMSFQRQSDRFRGA